MTGAGSTPKSLSEVSKMLADFSKGSAIAVTPTSESIPISSEAKDVEDMIIPLKRDGYATLMSNVAVLYRMGIPPSHLGVLKGLVGTPQGGPAKAYKEVTIPATAVKDNAITFETKPGEAIKISSLMNLDLTRRIMISPYYNFDNTGDFPLAMSAKDMPAADFVKALARGLSGKLAVEKNTYTINFDASNFRSELSKVLVLAQKGVDSGKTPSGITMNYNGGTYSDYQEYQEQSQPAQSNSKASLTAALSLLGQTIAQMNDQLLEQTFAFKNTSTKLSLVKFASLQNPAVNYLKSSAPPTSAQSGADVQRQQVGRGGTANLAALVSRVDPNNPGSLIVTTDFRIQLELNLMSGRRPRPGNPQNVDAANKITIQVL